MKLLIVLRAPRHLGDWATLTSVLYNLHKAFPQHDYQIHSSVGAYSGLFKNNPMITVQSMAKPYLVYAWYESRPDPHEAFYGVYPLGFLKRAENCMTALYGKPVKLLYEKSVADFYISPEEYEQYPIPYKDYCLINANTMTQAPVKGYPYYQEVIDLCSDIQFIQIGGDYRDIREPALRGAIDLRGRTTVRQLVLLASKAKYILSGPSGIVHIGSAFPQVKKLVVIGAREPVGFWGYPNTICFTSKCREFGGDLGCMEYQFGPDTCNRYCIDEYKKYPMCMADIFPEEIAKELCTNE